MSDYHVDRIAHLQRERNQLKLELEKQTSAAIIYAALAAVGWGCTVLLLFITPA